MNCHCQPVINCSGDRNSRKSYEICSKFTIKTLEWFQRHCFGAFIVNLEHVLDPFLVFAVVFEQLVACWNWSNNVQLHGKLWKANTSTSKQSFRLRTCSLKEGVHFRKVFLEMKLKWRKNNKRSRLWKQKNSTCHLNDQAIYFKIYLKCQLKQGTQIFKKCKLNFYLM